MYLYHALKQSTTLVQVCKNLLPKAGKRESPSTNAWIRDVPDTPRRQASKRVTDTSQKSETESVTAWLQSHSIIKPFT